ncbi:hypothetical protein HYH03_015313 [Edaphochlamys debaryana]|uniref:Importin N-terminal domain-containing protein n=1 Tax=Edaphochlamys debaryana TaxID=47281 RepID=A0A835XS82_9CHLO|nr:hypothetical protein HYH03_015313 [Edaphochlamys debaryana]|eukprot:KAG2485990.1 hypothetical protein HYH03_015313 [Edaphochlamys debaryana]
MAADDGGEGHIARQVVGCLQTCLYSIDGEARKVAEQALEAGVQHAGFAQLLGQLAIDPTPTNNDLGVRQMAAVLLKQVIKRHWSAEHPKFIPPELSPPDKDRLRALLPTGLSDANSKVRTAIAMCIAAIAQTDPDGWPGLIENLVGAIHAQRGSNSPLVHGAIRCLAMLSDDIDEQKLPQVAQALLPELHRVASDPGSPPELRAAALSILHDLLHALGYMAGVYQREVRDLLVPLVEPWLPLLCAAVAQPLCAEDPSGWGVRMLALRCLTQLLTFFAKPLQPHVPAVSAACWGMVTGSLGTYQTHLVLDPSEGGQAGEGGPPSEVDAEGNTLDLESLLAQLFELLMALVAPPRHAKLVRPALGHMALLTVAYMQMTAQQAADWASNASQYVADEDDGGFSVRAAAEMLLGALMEAFGLEAVGCVLDAVERRAAEAEAARVAGQAGWWKLREAALLAAGCCADGFPGGLEEGDGGGGRTRAAAAALRGRLQALVDGTLAVDMQGASTNPLLLGRALWLGARLHPALRPDQRAALLAAAAGALGSGLPLPVKIGACRVLAALASRVPPSVLSPLAPALYGGAVALLGTATEESLNLALEALPPLIRADPAAAAAALPSLAGPVLQVWSRFVADPLVSESALSVLQALARVPACIGPLAQLALPPLAAVLAQPLGQPPGLLEGCLGLLAALVRPGTPEVVAAVAGACLGPCLALLPGGRHAGADDSSGALAHGATELVVELLRAGREDVLTWGAPSLAPEQVPSSTPSSTPLPATPSATPALPGTPAAPSTPTAALATSAAAALLAHLPPHVGASSHRHPSPLPLPLPPPASPPDASFAALLSACLRQLDPATDEYATCLTGDLAHALLACLPSRAATQPVLGLLLGACASKLAGSNLAPLVGGLVAALSAMAVAGGGAGWVEALEGMRLPARKDAGAGQAAAAAEGATVSGLEAVLPLMLERYGDVRGRAACRTVAGALLELLRSRHPLLLALQVRGKRLDLSAGVRTRRATAAAGGEQWSRVPAAARIVALAAELAVDAPWQAADEEEAGSGSGDDGEGEWVVDGEDEEDMTEEEDGAGEQDDEEDMSGPEGVPARPAGGLGLGLGLTLSGKAISQQQEASLDDHINRSPTMPSAESALVAGYDSPYSGTTPRGAFGGGRTSEPSADAVGGWPLPGVDVRAGLVEVLRAIQAAPDSAAFLAAAIDLLPPRRQQQVAKLLGGYCAAEAAAPAFDPYDATSLLDVLAALPADGWAALISGICNVGGTTSVRGLHNARRACKALCDGIDANVVPSRLELSPVVASGNWIRKWPSAQSPGWSVPSLVHLVWSIPDRGIPQLMAPGGLLSTFLASPLEARQRMACLSVKLQPSRGGQAARKFPASAVRLLLASLPELATVSLQTPPPPPTKFQLSTLFAALAALPKLRDLTFAGAGCGMLGIGVGPLAGSTQLTRLCVEHEKYMPPSDPDDGMHPRCPFDMHVVLKAARALGSVQELALRPAPGVMDVADIKRAISDLPGSVRQLELAHLRQKQPSPGAAPSGGRHAPASSVCYSLVVDVAARAITVRAEDGCSSSQGCSGMSSESVEWLLQPFLLRDVGLGPGEQLAPGALPGLQRVRLEGIYEARDDVDDLRRNPSLKTLQRLRSEVERFEVEHVRCRLGSWGGRRRPDLGALLRGVEALGVPEDLTLQERDREWQLSLRSHPPPPEPLGQGGGGGGGGGADSEDGSWGGSEAEEESAAEVLARLWAAEVARARRSRSASSGPDYGGCLLLRGRPVAALLSDEPALRSLLAQVEAAAAEELWRRMRRPLLENLREGGEPLLGQPLLRSFAALPAAGVVLVDCSSGPAAECAAAAARGVLRAAAASGSAAGEVREVREGAAGVEGGEFEALSCAECVLHQGSLLLVSRPASTQVLQAAWDGTDPGLGFEERLGAVLGARETLAGIQLDVRSLA